MREIKFRAWNKNEKRMLHGVGVVKVVNNYHPCIFDDGIKILQKNDYKLMQYTGLKDKNGREIYEGDVVRVKWNNTAQEFLANTEWIGKVFFDAGSFNIDGDWVEPLNSINGEIEVIGNIFENPELLEQEG